jgi:glycosyltransferase involved in cell wall biosynthesis
MTRILHLTASTFLGGPERQMLGLAKALPAEYETHFGLFREDGRYRAFHDEAQKAGFPVRVLEHDTPRLRAAVAELSEALKSDSIDLLFCHGYKAGLVGHMAARRAKVPVVAVSRGWTYESLRVNLYELLDRLNLRGFDRVVCVSEGQARKVRAWRVPRDKVVVIPNAIDIGRFEHADPSARGELEGLFSGPVRGIVGAAGRLSPEKGFDNLIDAAAQVVRKEPETGFVVFGEGTLRESLEQRIRRRGLTGRFVLAGFRPDLDRLLPALDLLVQTSHTEGMPNVILEACAAGVPVVATAVGGTPEIVVDGQTGVLVARGDRGTLADKILMLLGDPVRRSTLGAAGRRRVREYFTFGSQAVAYARLAEELRRGQGNLRVQSTAVMGTLAS